MAHLQRVSPNQNDNELNNGERGESSDDSNDALFKAMEIELQNSTEKQPSSQNVARKNPLDTIPHSTYNKVLSIDSIPSTSPNTHHQNIPTTSQVINVNNLITEDKTQNTKMTKISLIVCIILLFYSVIGVTYLLMESYANGTNCGCSSSQSQQLASGNNNDGNDNDNIMYNTTLMPSYSPSKSPISSAPSLSPSSLVFLYPNSCFL